MKKEVAEAWVKDLRKNPRQAKNVLYDGKGHCCLGRLCLVLGAEFENGNDGCWYPKFPDKRTACFSSSSLSEAAMDKADMKDSEGYINSIGNYLSNMNDSGMTFAEIADIIEQHWEIL